MSKKILHKKLKERMQHLVIKKRKPLLIYASAQENDIVIYTAYLDDGKIASRVVIPGALTVDDRGWVIMETTWDNSDSTIYRLIEKFREGNVKIVYIDQKFVDKVCI